MTHFTTRAKKRLLRIGAVLFWLLVWQLCSMMIKQEILLVSPVSAFLSLLQLAKTGSFWSSIAFSFFKIFLGFLLSLGAGTLLAALSCRFSAVAILLQPAVTVMKATPVASFTILALLWIRSQNLSVLVSFTMAFPILYSNLCEGILCADRELLEMAQVFHMSFWRQLSYIYLPAIFPFFISAVSLSVGLCWKSGIAAEVIGQPAGSVGGALYQAKVFLATRELFAWTAVIITVSLLFEKAVLHLAALARRQLEEK
ncbi:MAG: ABC transporter permease subunit [Provencibacterium sp.]|jgi:NitT/TauT family transport system permease protein|nr:ABC transporter permease subunit [Provencibacterium sp.]